MGGANAVLLSDTVGFIRDLPHHLVASFRSTLEDAIHAHVLLIVLDASDREAPMQLETVRKVLDEIGATTQPRILLLNKADRIAELPYDERSALRTLDEWLEREEDALAISAVTGAGLDGLRARVLARYTGGVRVRRLLTAISSVRLVDLVEKRCRVIDLSYPEEPFEGTQAVELEIEIGDRQVEQFLPLGESFLLDGEDQRPRKSSWGGKGKRRSPHLVELAEDGEDGAGRSAAGGDDDL